MVKVKCAHDRSIRDERLRILNGLFYCLSRNGRRKRCFTLVIGIFSRVYYFQFPRFGREDRTSSFYVFVMF